MSKKDRPIVRQSASYTGGQLQHRASAEVVVPIRRRVVPQPDGTTSTEISLDLKEVPIPERRYVADAAWVDIRNEIVRIMFGQRGTVGDHLRSLIVVNVFPEPTRNLVETSKDFIALYEEFLNRNKISTPELHAWTEEPSQTVALAGNMMAVTFAGREAEWDFFHLPPSGLRKLAERSDVAVDPVVRVDLATSLMAAIFNRLMKLVPELPAEAR